HSLCSLFHHLLTSLSSLFPTRRSSDLFSPFHIIALIGIDILQYLQVNRISFQAELGFKKLDPLIIRQIGVMREIVNSFFAKLNQDRKSTRLNSSHVSTSYAVFCLKKKK